MVRNIIKARHLVKKETLKEKQNMSVFKAVDGLKVHILMLLAIVAAVVEGPLGWDIPFVHIEADNWLEVVYWALGGSAVRDMFRKLGG